MKLSELNTGQRGVIVKVQGHSGFRRRIVEMGFIKGKTVSVILNAPLQDPVEYEVMGYKISLRREEASQVEVVSEDEALRLAQNKVKEDLRPLTPSEDDITDKGLILNKMVRLAEAKRHNITIALVGNPNCGKTSLFNIASGSNERVGNYSGVTVDAKEGYFKFTTHKGENYNIRIVDLPGTYSLSAFSPEEIYVRKFLIDETPDVVVNVIDVSNLERNLYLTTQLIDMHLHTVCALNIYDELEKRGDVLDYDALGTLLGMPMVPTVGRTGKGINALFEKVIAMYESNGKDESLQRHIHVNHGKEIEKSIALLKAAFKKNSDLTSKYSTRHLAILFLEKDKNIEALVDTLPNHDELVAIRYQETKRLQEDLGESAESAIINAKYGFIDGALKEVYKPTSNTLHAEASLTDKIDNIVTNRWLGFPIFFLILFGIFVATFRLGEYPMAWIEWFMEKLSDFASQNMAEGPLKDLFVDGVIGGIGAVIVFLPNILILYCLISILEDTGYMARSAFIMDKLMHRVGLHGKSFIPMIMGFGCNVPAVMATRTIENPKSRLVTMLVIPMMSCSARIPVYVLLIGAFFPTYPSLVMLSLYILGMCMAVIVAKLFSRFIMTNVDLPFVMELPPYRIPTLKSVVRHTWEKGKQYLQKMATIILLASILIWFLDNYPRHSTSEGATTKQTEQTSSYLQQIGKVMEPVMSPLGFDWRMNVGLLAGASAKELVVSTLGVMYSKLEPDAVSEEDLGFREIVRGEMSQASALSYLVFVLLYFPCVATIAVIKGESRSWKWAALATCYTTALAYLMSFITYRFALMFF